MQIIKEFKKKNIIDFSGKQQHKLNISN